MLLAGRQIQPVTVDWLRAYSAGPLGLLQTNRHAEDGLPRNATGATDLGSRLRDNRAKSGEISGARLPMPLQFGKPMLHYRSVRSTMEVAHGLGLEGYPEGTSVIADEQTGGRGRLGRSWLSEPGLGLYLSVVLRPECSAEELPILTLVAGVAVREAVAGLTGADCDLRWPNDVLIEDRKCCGILAEKGPALDRVDFVVIGIGVNLNHLEFPDGLRTEATSLRIETGREWSADAVRDIILESLAARCEQHRRCGPEAVLRAFQESSSYAAGRSVVVEGPKRGGQPRRGVTAGLNAAGQLLIRSPDGIVWPLVSGSVRPDGATM